MFSGVHDSLLVRYSVDAEAQELVFSLKPHHGSAPAPFTVVFSDLVAHCFEAPLLPAILLEVIPVSAESIITAQWPAIERGFKAVARPGPWADSLASATHFAQTSGVQGFQIESSYGLSGWVLARSARVVVAGP